jgi:CRP/FNR family cyclic AMP-dependent transcriptional regulator
MAKYPAQLRIAAERRAPTLGKRPVPKLNSAANAEPIPLFSSTIFGPVAWARSRTLGCRSVHSRGSLLFIEGQAVSGVYLIENGCVKLTICSGRGKSLILGFFGPQTVLGLPAAILGLPHEATAEIVKPVTARFVVREDLLRHLRQAGDAGLRAAQLVSRMLYSTLRDMEKFWLTDSVEQKLARFFVSLCPPRNGRRVPIHLALDLTHEDISQSIGVSRETVTRLLSRFKKRGILKLTRSMLTIFDLDDLKRIADWPSTVRSPEANPNAAVW